MPRRIDLPLNVAISVDMAPMLHAIMLPLTIPTPPLQMKFLKLLGEIVEEAHHSAICVPEQRLQFKRALECARTAAANSMFQSKVQGRDDAQEPRSPLLPTKAQEAQQARAEPRPQQERSPRAALATPLSGGCMHPIEEEQPKRRSSKEKKHRRSRAGRGEDFCIPGCSRSEEVEPPSIEDLEEGAPPVERRGTEPNIKAPAEVELEVDALEDMDPGMQIDEFFMSSELCHKDSEGAEGSFEADFIDGEASTKSKIGSASHESSRSRSASKGRVCKAASLSARRSSEQSNMAGESEDLAAYLSDESEHGNGDLSTGHQFPAPKGHSMPRNCEAAVPPTEPDKLRKQPVCQKLTSSIESANRGQSGAGARPAGDQGIMSSLKRAVFGRAFSTGPPRTDTPPDSVLPVSPDPAEKAWKLRGRHPWELPAVQAAVWHRSAWCPELAGPGGLKDRRISTEVQS